MKHITNYELHPQHYYTSPNTPVSILPTTHTISRNYFLERPLFLQLLLLLLRGVGSVGPEGATHQQKVACAQHCQHANDLEQGVENRQKVFDTGLLELL